MGSVNNAPSSGSGADGGSSLAARRARLRGSLARATFPPDDPLLPTDPVPSHSSTTSEAAPVNRSEVETYREPATQDMEKSPQFESAPATNASVPASAPGSAPAANAPAASSAPKITSPAASVTKAALTPSEKPAPSGGGAPVAIVSALSSAAVTSPTTLSTPPTDALELLTNIDSALSACATNLAALQRLSSEQTDVLKSLTNTLQNQTLNEIGLNLNSLTESLSAALEPMKAISELVPAMDQLVQTLEGRQETEAVNERLSPDQLVTSLADQLSAGLIDPWTFKCAYMAIYPSEHPADLLHRLVELLGTQRLSGDLFRAAYEAVQAAEPPARSSFVQRAPSTAGGGEGGGSINEEIRQQIEELQRANESLRLRQEERERELQNLLQQKDHELQEAQDLLNSRYDEFNARYEEVAEALSRREEEHRTQLENKEMELVEKESELNLLRAQMEELRNQTEEMVKDLQHQLADMKNARDEAPKASTSFFDSAPHAPRNTFDPNAMANQDKQAMSGSMQAVSGGMQAVSGPMPAVAPQQTYQQQTSSQPMPVQPQPVVVAPPQPQGMSPQGIQQPPGQPPGPAANQGARPVAPQPAPTTPFTPGSGSYGSGVRAQVFEVIVRQALAGAPWREICAGPMQVNQISPEEVEAEVKRRQALLNK